MDSLTLRSLVLACGLLAACSSQSKPPPGRACLMNSECNSPLLCTFGKCHAACAEARDCPTGQLCVKSSMGAVCQLPAETHCEYRSQCLLPLTCALDRQCRSECLADIDCPTKTQTCVLPDGVCAEPAEIDDTSKRLRNAQASPVPGAPGADGGADASTAPDASMGGSQDAVGGGSAGVCTDRLRNGAETDVDCGGNACPACAVGKSCGAPSDCASNQCIMGKCLECAPGTTKCSGKKQSSCMNGLWVLANQDCASGCDPVAGSCRVCAPSTCKSVRVIFYGATASQNDVQLAIDNGSVVRSASDVDPLIGQKNVLYGNFTEDKKQYTSDNTACSLPNYGMRTNIYYLAPLDGLGVASSWYSGAMDFKEEKYCQSCPNFGCENYISTPKKVAKIEILANSGDLTCKVCLYRGPTLSDADLIRCVSPNTTLMGADLDAANAPAVLQLDDGKRCGSY